jgi:hypothetical protein
MLGGGLLTASGTSDAWCVDTQACAPNQSDQRPLLLSGAATTHHGPHSGPPPMIVSATFRACRDDEHPSDAIGLSPLGCSTLMINAAVGHDLRPPVTKVANGRSAGT